MLPPPGSTVTPLLSAGGWGGTAECTSCFHRPIRDSQCFLITHTCVCVSVFYVLCSMYVSQRGGPCVLQGAVAAAGGGAVGGGGGAAAGGGAISRRRRSVEEDFYLIRRKLMGIRAYWCAMSKGNLPLSTCQSAKMDQGSDGSNRLRWWSC